MGRIQGRYNIDPKGDTEEGAIGDSSSVIWRSIAAVSLLMYVCM